MIEQGKVVGVKGENASVRINRVVACESCGLCGMSASEKHIDIEVRNTLGVKEGDTVEISFKDGLSARVTAIVYLIPLAIALLLMWAGYLLSFADWILALVFVVGLGLGFLFVRLIDKKYANKKEFVPVLNRVITQEVNSDE
jgi:positive regulator of sigma E activity